MAYIVPMHVKPKFTYLLGNKKCHQSLGCCCRADSRFAPSQWETALHCNDASHWLGASLESALCWMLGSWPKKTRYLGATLTHWGRVTHICVGKLISIGSDNGLSPGRRQAIIWTNAEILLIGPLATNFSEILIKIHSFSFKKMHLKMSSAKGRLFSLGLNELIPDKHDKASFHKML